MTALRFVLSALAATSGPVDPTECGTGNCCPKLGHDGRYWRERSRVAAANAAGRWKLQWLIVDHSARDRTQIWKWCRVDR